MAIISFRRASATLAVVLSVAITATACGSSPAGKPAAPATSPATSSATSSASAVPSSSVPNSSSAPTSSSAPPSSAASSAPALPARYTPPKRCLLTKSEVSSVLGGTWRREDQGEGSCLFASNRGAVFSVSPIKEPPAEQRAALADARVHSCGGKQPRDVSGTDGGFICIEHSDGNDLVEGNLVARGYFWLFVAVGAGSDKSYPAQRKAIAAVMQKVRR